LRDVHSKYGDLVKWQIFSQKQVKNFFSHIVLALLFEYYFGKVITFNADHVKKIFLLPDNAPIRPNIAPFEEYSKFRNIPMTIVNA
jgi:hypothetical protein